MRVIEDMPARLFLEWLEYEHLEPFGARRDNYHAAMIAFILANVHRDPKRPPVDFDEFFYRDPETAEEIHDRGMLETLRTLKKSH